MYLYYRLFFNSIIKKPFQKAHRNLKSKTKYRKKMTNLKRSSFQAHPFHLVSPSPWPLFTCISLLTLTTSGVLTMHSFANAEYFLFTALMSLILCMALWWRDVISEGTYLGNHTLAVQRGLNMGVALFIVSEAFFFLAIFWAYFHSALSPTVELGAHWPPMGIEAINPFELPLINTVILLSSGFTVTYAHHCLIQGNRKGALYGLVFTILLAVIFTGFQYVEYNVSFFTISDGAFGSCFYFGTGLIIQPESSFRHNIKSQSNLCFKLSPYWITGFADAESSFSLRASKIKYRKTGWRILPIFSVELHQRDLELLKQIHFFFGVGTIYSRKNRHSAVYYVQSFADLTNIIVPHFLKYPLMTKKLADFLLFKQALELINKKALSCSKGLQEIINIKASMNHNLSDILNLAFPNTIPVSRPDVTIDIDRRSIDPNWLVGFVDGEGCFHVSIKQNKSWLGHQVLLSFSISQHSRDQDLLNKISKYLDCGKVRIFNTRKTQAEWIIYKFIDIKGKIIPFFSKYSLKGVKQQDFLDFEKISEFMHTKSHLTVEGLNKVREIKSNMNRSRDLRI